MENVQKLEIAGARGTVEVDGVTGIFYKIRVDDEVVKRTKGGWPIPMRNGKVSKLSSRGIVPGFQKLYMDEALVYAMGGHVEKWLRALMFLPFLLIFVNQLFGLILGVLLFFMNISAVKNDQMPMPVRAALPIINTVAGGVILALLTGMLS